MYRLGKIGLGSWINTKKFASSVMIQQEPHLDCVNLELKKINGYVETTCRKVNNWMGYGSHLNSWLNEYILVSHKRNSRYLSVINHESGEIVQLPACTTFPVCKHHKSNGCKIGMGFDSVSRKYKCFHLFFDASNVNKCEMLNLDETIGAPVVTRWQQIHVPAELNLGILAGSKCVELGHECYWKLVDQIVGFSFVTERFVNLELPKGCRNIPESWHLFDKGGCLMLLQAYTNRTPMAQIFIYAYPHGWERREKDIRVPIEFYQPGDDYERFPVRSLICNRFIVFKRTVDDGEFSYFDLVTGVISPMEKQIDEANWVAHITTPTPR